MKGMRTWLGSGLVGVAGSLLLAASPAQASGYLVPEMDAEAMAFPDASFDKVVGMYVVSVVARPARLLEELHRVCRPDGEIFIVNHFRSDNRFLGALENALAGFSSQLGFRPDFDLREVLPDYHNGDVSRVNLFQKIVRLRNGVSHKL